MKTFNQAGKDELISILEAHAKADNIIKGTYWNDGKGCAVGCTLHDYAAEPDDHSQYETLFGIPRVLAKLEDTIFEGLPVDSSKQWPLRFANAVPVDTDISNVFPKFMMFILTDPEHGVIKYAKTDRIRTVIKNSSDLYLGWPNIDRADAAAAAAYAASASAAYAAAAYAAYAADAAADARADAAYAAYAAAADATAYAATAYAVSAAAYAAAYAVSAADAAAADAADAAADAAAADADADAAYADARQSHYKVMASRLLELLQDSAND